MCAWLGGLSLIELPMRHVEEVVHDQGGVRALKVVLRNLLRRHVQILNLVYQDRRNFVDISVSCRG